MGIEKTGNHCQHADDLGRDVSNAILDWQRRNPGRTVLEFTFKFNEDVMAPYGYITSTIKDNEPEGRQ